MRITVRVVNSKQGDCPADTETAIEVATLQEMHNQFRVTLSAGMEDLARQQGQGGIPTGPPAGVRTADVGKADPDADIETVLIQQAADADRVESELRASASPGQ